MRLGRAHMFMFPSGSHISGGLESEMKALFSPTALGGNPPWLLLPSSSDQKSLVCLIRLFILRLDWSLLYLLFMGTLVSVFSAHCPPPYISVSVILSSSMTLVMLDSGPNSNPMVNTTDLRAQEQISALPPPPGHCLSVPQFPYHKNGNNGAISFHWYNWYIYRKCVQKPWPTSSTIWNSANIIRQCQG